MSASPLEAVEQRLEITFPESHRRILLDLADSIHGACDVLLLASEYPLLRLLGVNEFLRSVERPDPWPQFLVAFASNGCGDYFAYDLRTVPIQIRYMDPDLSVQENLDDQEYLGFRSFGDWRDSKLANGGAN